MKKHKEHLRKTSRKPKENFRGTHGQLKENKEGQTYATSKENLRNPQENQKNT